MISDCPIKFRIIELVEEKPMWNYEVVDAIRKEFGMDTAVGRDNINYDCIECVSSGFFKEVDWAIDTDGSKFDAEHPGRLLTRYEITGYGRETIDELKKKVNHYTPSESEAEAQA